MSKGLSALIAVTCLVVLGAVGFWSWKLLSDQSESERRAEQAALRSACSALVSELKTAGGANRTLAEALTCIEGGALTVSQLRSEGLGGVADQVEEHVAKFGG